MVPGPPGPKKGPQRASAEAAAEMPAAAGVAYRKKNAEEAEARGRRRRDGVVLCADEGNFNFFQPKSQSVQPWRRRKSASRTAPGPVGGLPGGRRGRPSREEDSRRNISCSTPTVKRQWPGPGRLGVQPFSAISAAAGRDGSRRFRAGQRHGFGKNLQATRIDDRRLSGL
jgi:hypothetical protein